MQNGTTTLETWFKRLIYLQCWLKLWLSTDLAETRQKAQGNYFDVTLIVIIYLNSVRSRVMLNPRKHLQHLENKVKILKWDCILI